MDNTRESSSLVVLSGGQDSTTCMYWAKQRFERVVALTFSYGQKHAAEVGIAEQLAREADVEWHHMELPFVSQLSTGCSLTDTSLSIEEEKPADAPPTTFVPGRNLFFLSIAAVFARERGIHDLVTGVGQTDFSGYPDCRDAFIKSLNVTLNLAIDEPFRIHTPLMWLDKAETWALADRLGVFDIIRYRTLTCYNGVIGDGCGHCPACQLRRHGLQKYLLSQAK
ncbi:MAG: 7-cyano-7-deazaguanine synthase QueC [Bacteroidaceae bacterium]|nr:7-cyano-7-deazaguanine synthase QueC [Bacteroidaceae bacterium]